MKRFLYVFLALYIGFMSVFIPYKNVHASVVPFAIWGSESAILYLASALGISVGSGYVYLNQDDFKTDMLLLKDSMIESIEMDTSISEVQQDTSVAMLDSVIEQATLTGHIIIDKTSDLWNLLKDWSISLYDDVQISIPNSSSIVSNDNLQLIMASNMAKIVSMGGYAGRFSDWINNPLAPGNSAIFSGGSTYVFTAFTEYSDSIYLKYGNSYSVFTSINKYIKFFKDGVTEPKFSSFSKYQKLDDFVSSNTLLYSNIPNYAIDNLKETFTLPTSSSIDFDTRYQDTYIDNWDVVTPHTTIDRIDIPISNVAIDGITDSSTVLDLADSVAIPIDTVSDSSIPISEGAVSIPLDDVLADSVAEENTLTESENNVSDTSKSLINVFPFCIPFDLINSFKLLKSAPEVPHWEWTWQIERIDFSYTFVIDFKQFESLAIISRSGFLLLFIVGLILLTRNIIRG